MPSPQCFPFSSTSPSYVQGKPDIQVHSLLAAGVKYSNSTYIWSAVHSFASSLDEEATIRGCRVSTYRYRYPIYITCIRSCIHKALHPYHPLSVCQSQYLGTTISSGDASHSFA